MSTEWLKDMKKARKALRDDADRAVKAWRKSPTAASTSAAIDRLEKALAEVDEFPS